MKYKYIVWPALFAASNTLASDLLISGVLDASLTGGTPKAVELYVVNDIADLSLCSLGIANNGGGSDGQEFTFPSGSATAGSYLYVASETTQFNNFLGFQPDYISGSLTINGDDAVELFCAPAAGETPVVVDVFGDINTDGTGQAWEYQDGWAYRVNQTTADGSNFMESNWTFSGTNVLDGQSTNAGAPTPFPARSFVAATSGNNGGTGLGVLSSSLCFNCPDVPIEFDAGAFNAQTYYAATQALLDTNAPIADVRATLSDTLEAGHKFLTYSQIWTSLTYTDEDPNNTNNVILWYSGRSQAKNTNGSGAQSSNRDNWNREHSWPNSHGFPEESQRGFTDIHHLRPADISINGSRGNLDFDNSDGPLAESPINRIDNDSFEPRDEIKGDVARMMLYVDVRYEGTEAAVEGQPLETTPDVQLVNRLTSAGEPALGFLCTLLAWHEADPVTDAERLRHDRAYSLQGNRNPFIDNPDWVERIYGTAANCDGGNNNGGNTGGGNEGSGNETPSSDTSLIFINELHYDNSGSDQGEAIEVAGPAGTNLAGASLVLYDGSSGNLYNTVSLSGVIPNQQSGFGTLSFSINGIQNGGPDGIALVDSTGTVLQFLSYEGSFTAANGPALGSVSTNIGVSETSGTSVGTSLQLRGEGTNASDFTWASSSTNSFGTVNAGQTFVNQTPFINEIHYDNSGSDVGEGIEIAGAVGIDLAGTTLVLYDGSSGNLYRTVQLSGVIPNQQNGFGTVSFSISGIQNGGPDGMALVDASGNVLQFLSYEGAFIAANGPASGMTSNNIGVSETSGTAVGSSLQLRGSGMAEADFSWVAPSNDSFGAVNAGQTFQ